MREQIAQAKKIVVKIGSSSLTDDDLKVSAATIDRFVDALQARMEAGSDVYVVSSGAVAAGMPALGLQQRPKDLATKQACASVGQVFLANEWGRSFARYQRAIGQVLLTASDASDRTRTRNAQRTIDRLRKLHCVPIINENDTVATTEINFGDNDRLAAIVANLIGADALVLLSDVDGLYDRNPSEPGARFIAEVVDEADLEDVVAGGGGKVGTGGMGSKVSAARLAAKAGVPVLLTSADKIEAALGDASVGTCFHAGPKWMSAWKFWALYAAEVAGTISVDAGAHAALSKGGNSLLAVGITDVDGEFRAGDIVEVHGVDGQIIGRGEVAFDAAEVRSMMGQHHQKPVIHADYLSNI